MQNIQILSVELVESGRYNKYLVIDNKYNTEHKVFKSTLLTAKILSINSAVEPLDYVKKRVETDHPELYKKIEILEVDVLRNKKNRSASDIKSNVVIKILKTGKIVEIALFRIHNQMNLKVLLDEVNYEPIHAVIKHSPQKLFHIYFIQLVHSAGYKSYKIGWTSYDKIIKRIKTMGNGWKLYHCLCFEKLPAIDICNFEKKCVALKTPEVPVRFQPHNGFSEFFVEEEIEDRWVEFSNMEMSFLQVCELIDKLIRKLNPIETNLGLTL